MNMSTKSIFGTPATTAKPEKKTNSSENAVSTVSSRLLTARMVQNFHLVWLDGSINKDSDDFHNSITKLRQVVNTVNTFIDADECIDFITDSTKEKAFMVVSEELIQIIAPVAQDISQVSFVYIFSDNKVLFEKWAPQWPKIKGVHTDIASICEVLKRASQDCEQNAVSISFVKTTSGGANPSLDTLHCSFMYTKILKEILLTIDFEQGHINDFLSYYREQVAGNNVELKNVEKLRHEYHHHQPIWWYTYNSFLYSMLNRALRLMEVDLIMKMGFFVRDLHNNIVALYSEQYGRDHNSKSFIVYRGQGLSHEDFNKLKETQGGLLSFNNFLSTSLDRAVSYSFAESAPDDPNLIGVFFKISIDPSTCLSPFANVKNVSSFQEEEEVLFSMHAVFRIGQMKQLDKKKNGLWQVKLTLTGEDDPLLHSLTESLREETSSGAKGWLRLGQLLIKMGQFDKAEELYEILLQQATNEREREHVYHMLGMIKNDQGKYAGAVRFYEQSVAIKQKTLPATHADFAAPHNNIGEVYHNMGEYSKALSYYEQALEIEQKTLPAKHLSLATCYNNIGLVYSNMGEYSKALSYFEQALEIWQKTLPAKHPSLATSYNNIGTVYYNMGEYSKALSYYEQALEIRQKTLPATHPSLATSYNNIGGVYDNMGEYSKALSYYEQALEIRQKTLPANHPDLATSYNNIGGVYDGMGEYSKALSYYEQALEIFQKTLPANHSSLATSYNNIGGVYDGMGEYSKALSYYEQALEIRQKTLPANHPDLATSYNNIGGVYDGMGEHSKALSYYEQALEIWQKTLPANHSSLAASYNNIGLVYYNMGEYSKALSSHEQALEIFQKTLPANHPSLVASYNNIGLVYYNMGEHSKALSYLERALDIWKRSLPPNHSNIKDVKESIEVVKKKL